MCVEVLFWPLLHHGRFLFFLFSRSEVHHSSSGPLVPSDLSDGFAGEEGFASDKN